MAECIAQSMSPVVYVARSTSGESVLCRVVRIFEAFDSDTPAVTVSELAKRADLPLATASRLVNELVGYEWLRRDSRGRVGVGVRIWELASRASPTLNLRAAAMPFMQDLHAVVGHHVQLAVLHHREALYIERLSAPGAVRNLSRPASRLPLHASAPGLVLLAHSPIALQDAILSGPLTPFTRHTVTDPKVLRSLLGEIRRCGLAFCVGHIDETTTSIAAPLRAADGRTVAALSILVPNGPAARATVPALLAAARGVSRALSADGPGRASTRP